MGERVSCLARTNSTLLLSALLSLEVLYEWADPNCLFLFLTVQLKVVFV